MTNVLIGSDPEFFVTKKGTPHHVIHMTGGTKHMPRITPSGSIQEDNVLLEVNTKPTDDAIAFANNIEELVWEAFNLVSKEVELSDIPSYNYPVDIIKEFPMEAFVFGCDPDFNAYTGDVNAMPKLPDDMSGFRSAGGHIHIGWNHLSPVTDEEQNRVGQMCDLLLGVWGVTHGDDLERRKLYGKAGCVRYKEYGIEYRTCGNFWTFKRELCLEIHKRATKCFTHRKLLDAIHSKIPPETVINCINNNDVKLAQYITQVVDLYVAA